MKRIHTLSTNGSLVNILLVFLAYNPAFSQEKSGIFFDLNDQYLNSVLDTLIDEHDLSIVYQDNYLENVKVTAVCNECTPDEAIALLLDQTGLQWTKRENQFIIVTEKGWDEPYNITGYIIDSVSGEFIPHANISIINTYKGTISNENGFFNIPQVYTEKCSIQVSYIGYGTETIAIQKRDARNSIIRIHLDPTVLTTDNITVTGKQIDIMAQGEQISQISYSPRHVAMLPNLGENDVLRSLQLLPGIQSGNAGSAGLYIRGGTPDQNQILLDGMTLYQTDHFFGFVSSINSHAIKDIQVYKGGVPARYGGRVNSVIEMTGKNGNMNKTRFSLLTNQISNGFSIQQPLFNRGSFLFMHRKTFSDQFRTDFYQKIHQFLSDGRELNIGQEVILVDSTVKQIYDPSFHFSDMNAKVLLLPSQQNMITLSYYASEDQLTEHSSFDFNKSGYIYFQQEDLTDWQNNGVSLKMSHQWQNASYSQLLVSKTMYRSDHELLTESITVLNDTLKFNDHRNDKNKINDLTFHFNHDWKLYDHQLQSGVWFSDYSTDYKASQQNSIQFIDRQINEQVLAFYFQDKMNILEKGIILAGFRASQYSFDQHWTILPRINTHYELTDHSRISGAWGRHIQYLHRFSNDFISSGSKFVWLLSADTLKPVEADKIVIGYQHEFNALDLNIEYYYNNKSNVANFSRLHHYTNYLFPADSYDSGLMMQGKEISQGIEVLLKKSTGMIQGWLSYNYGLAQWKFAELNNEHLFPSGHDRTHDLKSVIMTNIGPWQLTFSWLYFSGKAFTPIEDLIVTEDEDGNVALEAKPGTYHSSRLPRSHRLDMNFMRFKKWNDLVLEYGLSLFNVYNNKYISHKRYTFASADTDISVNNVKIMGITPMIYLKISR